MKVQLLQAWRCNNEKNELLLQNIPEELLSTSLSSRGRTIGERLAHLHNTRITWTEHVAKPLYQKALLLPKDTLLMPPVLLASFENSAAIISQIIDNSWENGGKLPSFKAGLIPFISYLISHESHHRGNILLTLKQSDFKLPETLKWGLWEWQK